MSDGPKLGELLFQKRHLSPNLCQAMRYLHADGWTYEKIQSRLDLSSDTVCLHLTGKCNCPELDSPVMYEALSPEEIREKRKEAGLLQKELAALLDVRGSTVSTWESGDRTPRTKHLMELHRVFGRFNAPEEDNPVTDAMLNSLGEPEWSETDE